MKIEFGGGSELKELKWENLGAVSFNVISFD
jgi:hypothetical protein